MKDAFGVEREVVSKRREYKMKGAAMVPAGRAQNVGPHEYVMRKTGQTMFKKRPKYEVGLMFPKFSGNVALTPMKVKREFGDQLHRSYKAGKTKKVDGSKVVFM